MATAQANSQASAHESGFQRNGFTVLPTLLRPGVVRRLLQYALARCELPSTDRADVQVPGTPSVYCDPVMDAVLHALSSRVAQEAGGAVYPTYSYFRVYKHGDVLPKHQDRPACEISLTVSLGFDPSREPWTIWMDSGEGPSALKLWPGDAALYRGMDVMHWREAFPGTYAAQLFLHYVYQHGAQREWKHDKRASLRRTVGRILARAALGSVLHRHR